MNTPKQQSYLIPISIVGVLFFAIGFALGINGLLVPYLEKPLHISSAESYLLLTATFLSFVIFSFPAGMLIKKIGYKKTMALSFVFFAVGLYLFVPAARAASFPLFLIGSFISGTGNTLLQASVNPYVTICGPIEKAAQRMSIMGILNKGGWAVAPIFLALFISDLQVNIDLNDITLPFYIIVGVFILLGIFSFFSPLPEVCAEGEDETADTKGEGSLFQFPHLLLGAFALFLYVGVETIALATPVDYATTLQSEGKLMNFGFAWFANPANYTTFTVLAMWAGYILGAILMPKVISQNTALKICAWIGTVCSLVAVLVPSSYGIYFIALLGLGNSLLWGPIWALAMQHLGNFTKAGGSLLTMAIVGGALIPLLFGWCKDLFGDIQQAYLICFPMYLFILYYAYMGYKVGLKK
ncbi:MAG: MFS transporter, partial [Bacteroides sp.]|nr:MFS transporter [Bacteroides sp.]